MNSRKVQAQMQIDVSFLSDTTKLVKQLQTATSQLKLDGNFGKQFSAELSKSFKEVNTIMSKMTEGLSKKGLSTKEYTNFFNEMHAKLKESIKFTDGLKQSMEDIYNNPKNKQGLKDLEKLKETLKQINDLASDNKTAQTRKQSAIDKMREETGIDYNISKRTLSQIASRKADKKGLTKTQQEWMGAHHLDEGQLKRALELRKQILAHEKKMHDYAEKSYELTKQKSIEGGQESVLKDIANLEKGTMSNEAFKHNLGVLNNLTPLIKDFSRIVNELLPRFNIELQEGGTRAEKLAAAGSTINDIFAQFGLNFSIAAILVKFKDLAVEAFNFYKSLDSALNEIYVVSNLTSDAVNGLTADFLSMSKKTGMALDDVTRSATLFYQQGLNTEEVMEMTEVTSQFAKVAGIDATDAADKLTAAVNGYCLAAEDASLVADKFNKVAAASAADIDELSTAFSKAAAQANQAGVGMDNYLAYIATMVEATREAPENIGTSLKTIMSRMQQIKEAGTTEDGETDVNQAETALRSVGVALRDTNGELRNLEDVFADLGPKWNSLDRNTQAYLGTIIAGTRQQSRFITLMQNWDRVLDLSEQSANSAGQQALMHAKAMDSITSKMQQMQVAWQEFISNLTESDFLKGIISGITKLIDLFNDGNKPLALFGLGIMALSKKVKELQPTINEKLGGLFGFGKNKDGKQNVGLFQELGVGGSAVSGLFGLGKNDFNIGRLKIEETALKYQLEQLKSKIEENKTEEEHNSLLEEQNRLEEKLTRNQTKQNELLEQNKKNRPGLKENMSKFGGGLSKLGMGMTVGGMMVSSSNANVGGLLSGTGSGIMALGQFATGQWVTGLVSAVMSVYQITQTLDNWESNLAAKITEAVDQVEEKLTNLSNLDTGIRSVEELKKEYEELSNKIYKTEQEQTELSNIAQQLGDTLDIDTITDSYGNMTISLREVNKELQRQKELRDDALEALRKQELDSALEATTGLLNTNTLTDYYDELFTKSYGSYKSLLNGIEDELTDETRAVSSSVARALSENLETSIMDEVENHAFRYADQGLEKSLTGLETSINEKINSNEWNDLYTEIAYLQENINELDYNEVQDKLNNFYDNWSAANDLTQTEWNLLVDSINNTIFDNPSLMEFYGKVADMNAKATKGEGNYYNQEIKALENQLEAVNEKYELYASDVDEAAAMWTEGAFLTGTATGASIGSFFGPLGTLAGAGIGAAIGTAAAVIGTNVGQMGEDKKRVELMEKSIKELKKQREEYLKTLDEENALLHGTEDVEKWLTAQDTVAETLKSLNIETQNYLSNLTSLYDMNNMTAEGADEYANVLQSLLPKLEDTSTNGGKYNIIAKDLEENGDEYSKETQEKLQQVLDEAYTNLELPSGLTFSQIADELDSVSEGLRTTNKLMAEFNEQGYLSLDSFKDLAKILDGIDIENLFAISDLENGVNYVEQYIDALDQLNLGFDENNGAISMNGEALQSLQKIQEMQTKSKIISMKNELIAKKYQTESEIAYIDAQIAGAQAVIDAIDDETEIMLTAGTLRQKADAATAASFQASMTELEEGYSADVQNLNTWTQAVLKDLDLATQAWGKYWKALNGEIDGEEGLGALKDKAQELTNSVVFEGSSTFTSGMPFLDDLLILGDEELQTIRDEMTDKIESLESLKGRYQETVNMYDAEIKLLESLEGADLSKLGTDGKETEELDKYIGKLKEIYNILNRIKLLEHRLNTLDTYSEVAVGKEYGNYLKERLGYTQELTDQYEFLVREQKKFANGYKEFIESSNLSEVFDFDEFGQIIINFEKYNALQDTAADGAKSLKEQADEMYDTYTSMFEELHGYFDEYIAYLQKAIDLHNEIIDSYIDVENKLADAIKEIYQKILDTKLDAIDQEKEALEELRDAREQARKDQDNAKELSNLQTSMQRAMMDSSGASDISFIKAQQDMNEKLEDIADDKYSEMLDDIISQLDEEQEALQENFDELFSNQEWLFDFLEKNVMNDKDKIEEILTQTEEWATLSNLEREKQLKELSTDYYTYIEGIKGTSGEGGTIYDVWNRLGDLQASTEKLDEALRTREVNIGNEVANAIANGLGGIQSSISSLTGGSPSPSSPTPTPTEDQVEKPKSVVQQTWKDSSYGNQITTGLKTTGAYVAVVNKDGKISRQHIWEDSKGLTYFWQGRDGKYVPFGKSVQKGLTAVKLEGQNVIRWLKGDIGNLTFCGPNGETYAAFKSGGFANFTGPAWLDGTPSKPEAVLNALQTEHFIKFTNALDNMYGLGNPTSTTSSVSIDTISFNVESMSSVEDGERAFNMFVDKFKEIGNRTGIKIDTFKNTL